MYFFPENFTGLLCTCISKVCNCWFVCLHRVQSNLWWEFRVPDQPPRACLGPIRGARWWLHWGWVHWTVHHSFWLHADRFVQLNFTHSWDFSWYFWNFWYINQSDHEEMQRYLVNIGNPNAFFQHDIWPKNLCHRKIRLFKSVKYHMLIMHVLKSNTTCMYLLLYVVQFKLLELFECGSLFTGYRHIRLCSNTGEEIPNCTLFIHVAITNKRGGGVSGLFIMHIVWCIFTMLILCGASLQCQCLLLCSFL